MKRRTDRIVPSSCWEQLRTGKVWQRLSLALLVAVMTMTAQTARATDIVTQDNFDNYFDDNGNLLESITSDELIFQGEFTGLVNSIFLDRSIIITGDNAILNDMAFIIAGDDVTLDNLTLVADSYLGNLIDIAGENVVIANCNITYAVEEPASVINLYPDYANNVQISNNTINFEGLATSDEELVTVINLDNVEDVIVDGNTIVASLPSLDIGSFDDKYFMGGLTCVNPIRVFESHGVELTNNKVDVTVNSYHGYYPTVQALYIVGSEDILVEGNDFKMVDEITPKGNVIYLYAVQCGFSERIKFIENNFDISTTGGQSGYGSANVLQTCSAKATFIRNNITCESNCSSLGIYIFPPYVPGEAKDLVIEDNFINVTGLVPESNTWSLLSGIEIETGHATIKNNTIYVQNKGGYIDDCPVSGISAIQNSDAKSSFDIKGNEIIVPDGKYAVKFPYSLSGATVTGNILCAHELNGDDAVYIADGNDYTVENNYLAAKEVTVYGQENYWTTFYCGGAGFSIDETDACAYTATVSGETITLHKLGQVIPKGTAVIIVSEDESIGMTVSSATVANMPQNDLHGVDVATPLNDVKEAFSADAILVLSNKGGNFGFHELATTNVPARKAFLPINDPSGARKFTMVFEDATGIEDIEHSPLTIEHYDGAWYSLDGRRLNGKPTAKGVYVNNGKKVVIK